MPGKTRNVWVDRPPLRDTLRKSANCIAPELANPKSPAAYKSAAPQFAGFWDDLFPEGIGQLANFLISELAANVAGKIPAFRISRQELIVLFRRELEVAIDFTAMKPQNTVAVYPDRRRLH